MSPQGSNSIHTQTRHKKMLTTTQKCISIVKVFRRSCSIIVFYISCQICFCCIAVYIYAAFIYCVPATEPSRAEPNRIQLFWILSYFRSEQKKNQQMFTWDRYKWNNCGDFFSRLEWYPFIPHPSGCCSVHW